MANIGDILGMLKDDSPSDKYEDKGKVFVRDTLQWLEETAFERDDGSFADYLRASSIHEVCARREAILNWAPHLERAKETPNAGRRLTVDRGHQEHKWWQNRYLGPRGVLWGHWVCLRCSEVDDDGQFVPVEIGLMPERCPNCKAPRLIDSQEIIVYAEMRIRDDGLRYSGHPDGLLVIAPSTKPETLLEIKTITHARWEELSGPEPEHFFQIHVYMRTLGLRDALVIYLDKGKQADWSYSCGRFYARNPHVKAFHVRFDLRFWGKIERRIRDFNAARALMARDSAVEADDVERFPRVCESKTCKLAAGCPGRDQCWSLRVPGE